jgi:UDP-N-acetylmuramate dehydrogenase
MTQWSTVCDALVTSGVSATCDGVLGARTTYRVGGHADVVAEVNSFEDLQHVAQVISRFGLTEIIVVGNGSNMLVSDAGYHGVAIVVNSLGPDSLEMHDDGSVTVSAHVPLPQMARQSVVAERCGLEWAVGVPGTVGGAIRMNAGGHGSDMASSVIEAHVVDLKTGHSAMVSRDDLGLRFRASALQDHHVVVSVRLSTSSPQTHDGRTCADEIAEIVRWRREFQPGGQNAGSVFVNPGVDVMSAGALIDAVGLRGQRYRSAHVTMKHANFIQADPDGRADDVLALMCEVQDAVREHHGIVMRSEIKLVGFEESVVSRFADSVQIDPHVADAASKLEDVLHRGDQVT